MSKSLHIPAPTEPIALGPFDLVEPIARGGMGQVWKARHRPSDIVVAVKIMVGTERDEEENRRRFRNEIRSVARLDHPNIVEIYDYGEVSRDVTIESNGRFLPNQPYLVMEYATGGTLQDRKAPMEWPVLREALLTLLEALAHAHSRRIIHRDLKPSNVLRIETDGVPRLVISDFGLSYVTGGGLSASPGCDARTKGTPSYMAPEQFRENPFEYGPWTDLYGLGCLAWELATGQPPFFARTPMGIAWKHLENEPPAFEPERDFPEDFERWLRRLLAKSRNARFESAAAAARALMKIESTEHASETRLRPFGRPGLFDLLTDSNADIDNHAAVPARWKTNERQEPSSPLSGTSLDLYPLRSVPLVDRQRERDKLWQTLREVEQHEQPKLVMLRGPSGTGKTRLAEWLCERATELECAQTFRAIHSPARGTRDGLAGMLYRHLRLHSASEASPLEALQSWFESRGSTEPYAWRSIASILEDAGLWAGAQPEGELQIERFEQRFAAIGRLLRLSAQDRSVIVHLDDLHWANESIDFAEYVLKRPQDFPFLVVATVRDDRLSEDRNLRERIQKLASNDATTELSIGPLHTNDQWHLVSELLDLQGTLQHQIVTRSDGNPLFATEIINNCVQRDLLTREPTGFRLQDDTELPIPESLKDIWWSRVENVLEPFSQEELAALEIAAAIGRDVDEWEWREACRSAGVQPSWEFVDVLCRQNLASRNKGGWLFAHPMLREAVEHHARLNGNWREANLACLTVLEQYDEAAKAASSSRLARYALKAEQPARAIEPLLAALDHSAHVGAIDAYTHLLAQLRSAIEASEVSEEDPRYAAFKAKEGRQLMATQQRDGQADKCFSTALHLAERHALPKTTAEALRGMGRLAHRQGEFQEAVSLYRQAIDSLEGSESTLLLVELYRSLGEALLRSGQSKEARTYFQKGLDVSQHTPVARAKIIHEIGISYAFEERRTRAEREIRKALRVFEEHGSLYGQGRSLNILGDLAREEGKLEDAEDYYDRAAHIADLTKLTPLGFVFLSRAQLALEQGAFDVAETRLMRARHEPQTQQFGFFRFTTHVFEAWCQAGLQNWEGVETALDAIDRFPSQMGMTHPDLLAAFEACFDLTAEAGRVEVADRFRIHLQNRQAAREQSQVSEATQEESELAR